MYAGTLHVRERLRGDAKATAIEVAHEGGWERRAALTAGEIGKLWGLGEVRIGDAIGGPPAGVARHRFAPPTLETVVAPVHRGDETALRGALARLAEEDPLINVRADETGRELSVSLYGEVQQEVIQATLAADFGIAVTFRETTTICVERPAGRGEALEVLNTDPNPFQATIGLRVEPAPPGTGIEFRTLVEPQAMPLYVYKSAGGFADAMSQYVRRTLREGCFGWQVTDCVVTLVQCGYRTLRVGLEAPAGAASAVLTMLGRLGAAVTDQSVRGDLTTIETIVPAARASELRRRLPGLTAGEGVFESTFDGYRRVAGDAPVRRRTTADPRHRKEYLNSLTREGARR